VNLCQSLLLYQPGRFQVCLIPIMKARQQTYACGIHTAADKKLSACCCRTVGTVIGWSSSGFYLGSRLSQIWKNHSRQSAEGLSLAMFACAITANVCYGLGILIRAYSWAVVRSSAPWILGSLGTVSLDLVIFTQVPHCHTSHMTFTARLDLRYTFPRIRQFAELGKVPGSYRYCIGYSMQSI